MDALQKPIINVMENTVDRVDDLKSSSRTRCKEARNNDDVQVYTVKVPEQTCVLCGHEFTSNEEFSEHLKHCCAAENSNHVLNSEHVDGTVSFTANKKQQRRSDPSKWPSRQTTSPCKFCGKIFTRRDHLRTHIMRMHTLDKPFKCTECDKSYVRQSDLTEHARCHDKEKPFPCSVCGRGFSRNGDLTRHMRMHLDDKRYKCDVCQKEFRETGNLYRHLRTHTHEKPFPCPVCDKRFSEKSTLHRHTRVHSGDRPYKCPFCDYSSSQSPNLTTHIRTHTGSKPFSCDHCARSFVTSSDKRRHMKTHTGEELCRCLICGKTYLQQYSLVIHMRTHTGDRPWRCVICDFGFIHKISWTKHVKKHLADLQKELGDEVNTSDKYKLAAMMLETKGNVNDSETCKLAVSRMNTIGNVDKGETDELKTAMAFVYEETEFEKGNNNSSKVKLDSADINKDIIMGGDSDDDHSSKSSQNSDSSTGIQVDVDSVSKYHSLAGSGEVHLIPVASDTCNYTGKLVETDQIQTHRIGENIDDSRILCANYSKAIT